MNTTTAPAGRNIQPEDFFICSLSDEIRVDQQCQALLKEFHQHLLKENNLTARKAGSLAGGADYFLRDYVIDSLRCNIFKITARQVSGFAGNWYIHRSLEPNIKELAATLEGVAAFYGYCTVKGWVDAAVRDDITVVCADLDYFRQRIDSFHVLQGDDYPGWCAECPPD